MPSPPLGTVTTCRLLQAIEKANPTGDIYLVTDNLASHKSPPIREWLEVHLRVEQVFIPKGAVWLNLQEAWSCPGGIASCSTVRVKLESASVASPAAAAAISERYVGRAEGRSYRTERHRGSSKQ
jgi:hypothetical protein